MHKCNYPRLKFFIEKIKVSIISSFTAKLNQHNSHESAKLFVPDLKMKISLKDF